MTENKSAITALVFSCLMLISPMAGAANVSTFSNGDSEITVEVRDSPEYTNIVDGTVNLPSGDTVTSASMKISTDFATHETYTTINGDSAQFVWDPFYNNQQTVFSNQDDFTYTEDTIRLVSGGFSTDFERTNGGFRDETQPPLAMSPGWEHGTLADGTVLDPNCNTGNECWGTNIYDFDNDYTNDDGGSGFATNLVTPALEVDPGAFIAKFSSWHGLHWNLTNPGTNPTKTYYDCGYVMVRNSSSNSFPPADQLYKAVLFAPK